MKKQSSIKMVITLFSIGVFMGGLDNGIMSSALTSIVNGFGVSATWGAWSITIYTLALAVSIPVMAKLSDRYGRKRLFLIGVTLFGIGSSMVALSHFFGLFLFSRLVQGFGGGGIFPIATGYITSTIPRERQGRALGMVGGMNGIAAILGPNIGSLILGATHDWHWLFWINVPIAAALLLFGVLFIAENRSEKVGKFDFLGATLLSAAILSVMYGLTHLQNGSLTSTIAEPGFFGFFGGGLILFVILLFVEKQIKQSGGDPFIPIQLLGRKEIRWTLLVGLASGLILASVIFLPAFNQLVLGWPASQSGYLYTPMALASGVGAMGGGAFMDKRGPIATLFIGMISAFVGAILFPLWVNSTGEMIVASALLGFGVGLTLAAPLNFLMTRDAKGYEASSLGMLSLVRQIGLTIGPILYADFLSRSLAAMPNQMSPNVSKLGASMVTALHDAAKSGFAGIFMTTAVIALLSCIALFFLRSYQKKNVSVA